MYEKCVGDPAKTAGTILFVHGSSMAGQPTFDLHVEGRPDSSVMDWFARRGYDCWCVDMEGYRRRLLARAPEHFVLIVWDTIRAYNVSNYGHPRETTPKLTQWAQKGVTYQTAITLRPGLTRRIAAFSRGSGHTS